MTVSIEFLGFSLATDPLIVTGVSLWALTLYLSLARLRQSTMESLMRWLNFAARSPHSQTASEKTHFSPEAQREFWASLLSIIPFLVSGGLCYYGIVAGLGQSWAISFGIMGVIISGIYELARANGASH
jgi:phytoene dehydrogenase-like protein